MTNNATTFDRRRKVLKTIAASGAITGISTVSAAKDASDETIAYESLSKSAREFFDQARETGSNETFASNFPEQLLLHQNVNYQGDVYSLNLSYTRQLLDDVQPTEVRPSEVKDSPDITKASELSSQSTQIVREAIESGYTSVGERLPQELHSNRHIQYKSTMYELNASTADRVQFKIEPMK